MNGYKHQFNKTIGGIKQILLTPVCNIREALPDPQSKNYSRITLHNPEKIAAYTFAEGAASYREETEVKNGIPSVLHILEFHTDKIDARSDRLIRELADASHCGLAAVVTTQNQARLLVGYSEEHRDEKPLRLEKCKASSGRIHTDPGHEAIRLTARDTAKARILTGEID